MKTIAKVGENNRLKIDQGREPDGSVSVRWTDLTPRLSHEGKSGLHRKLRIAVFVVPFLILPVSYLFAVYYWQGWQAFFGMIALWVAVFVLMRKTQKDARLDENPRCLIFRKDGTLEAGAPFQWSKAWEPDGLPPWTNIVSVEFGNRTNPDTPPPFEHEKRFGTFYAASVHFVSLMYADGQRRTVSESLWDRDGARRITVAISTALAEARRG